MDDIDWTSVENSLKQLKLSTNINKISLLLTVNKLTAFSIHKNIDIFLRSASSFTHLAFIVISL
jgi:hypothetical protein